ncbi:acetyl-CoA hydrolase/transferase family protein [Mycolicibacterium pyrenivorans]|uniref:acetyl-CoA hydrolase/transferase family protein n=1 Tax=Mycolicibacterium pyrenivorans TaxID=187102 RepID=UPI0021F2FE17|nr:acetyl-CoA hydrolase/transferase C-terminal domain-containing protein [Mycolicibacterium pyrenivorans]MCV7149967.1 acetyl-CoA hydrolase/transferase family protein [Mycolicibacterium pyrenivorans]
MVDARTAAAKVPAGSLLVFTSYEGEPTVLIDAMITDGVLGTCRGFQSVRGTRGLLADPEVTGGFRLLTYSPGGAASTAVADGTASFLPGSIHTICRLLEDGDIAPDVAVVNMSMPDDDGYCSFGTSTDFAAMAAYHAPIVIAQANAAMPRVWSEARLHVSEIDWFVEVNEPLTVPTPTVVDEVSERIGAYVAELVPDGACIEVGIGAIPDAALDALSGHRELGMHSGLLTDGMRRLYEKGVLTGTRKEIDGGLLVANQLHGSQDLYHFAATSPAVSMRLAAYTHDARIIGALSNFHALNSAIAVDMRGQVNSEYLRGRQVAGTGGSLDFAIGASVSSGGRCIVALPSTAGGGKYSRIVPTLETGSVVTLPAVLVDFVVTEYGTARLTGCTLEERARALSAVCHPDFRDRMRAGS